MKALTLWQPWAACIAHHGKRVENRSWRPPTSVLGKVIAIHAASAPRPSKRAEASACAEVERQYGVALYPGDLARGAIVATARVIGYRWADNAPCLPDPLLMDAGLRREVKQATYNRWFVGPCGWALSDVVALDVPVPCKGAQGLWTVPADVASEIARRA